MCDFCREWSTLPKEETMKPNERTILALRSLADKLEATPIEVCDQINEHLSQFGGQDDATRLFAILLHPERVRDASHS